MTWPNPRVSAPDQARTDWRVEYGGVLNVRTGEVELPAPTFAPCPYENCPECEKGAE